MYILLILVKTDGLECWVCDGKDSTGTGICNDENDKGELTKCDQKDKFCAKRATKSEYYEGYIMAEKLLYIIVWY